MNKQFLMDEDDYECYMEKTIEQHHNGNIPDDFPCLMITNEVDNLLMHEYEYPKLMLCRGCHDQHYVWRM
jgi:hypothetical protein